PKLEAAAAERAVACHFWQEIAAAGSSAPLARPATPKPAKARRLALYGAWRARQDDAETATPSTRSPHGRGAERR
ncbi:MAG: hypothetical protein ACREGK_09195, partial [Geminicoccales bacterium]